MPKSCLVRFQAPHRSDKAAAVTGERIATQLELLQAP
jgi:hypothetical protein